MTWTYAGSPDTATDAGRRDSVRLLIGDTDTSDQQVTDEEIAFALTEATNDVYGAAVLMCRVLQAKFSRLVDTSIESVRASYSQRAAQYAEMAIRLQSQARKTGAGLGIPVAGGQSKDEIESAYRDEDRVKPIFRVGQFSNPPAIGGGCIEDLD